MSVNIYDGTNLIPIAGKTVPMPTPDYVDAQYSSSTTYSKGMTCIEGNVRYRYKNSTATSGHRPPDSTYWEVLSVSDELATKDMLDVFADLSSFTTYTGSKMANRTPTDISTKYKQINNHVYLYITFSQIPSDFASQTTWDTWSILWGSISDTLPVPKMHTQLCAVDESGAFCGSYICKTDPNTNAAKILIVGNPSKGDWHDGEKMYIYGEYII